MSSLDPLAWTEVGTTEHELLKQLLELYWEAFEIEVADAILSLNNIIRLQKKYPDEEIGPQEIRHRVSARLGPPIMAWNPLSLDLQEQMNCIEEAGELAFDHQNVGEDYLMARMMLGALNMLDFDEFMEYRDPTLPSQRGPPRCLAEKSNTGESVDIHVLECDFCHEALRGLAWTCRLGCRLGRDDDGSTTPPLQPLDVCMDCYNEGKHPRQHLLRSPHRYAVSEALRAELTDDDFWALRRRIQRKQDDLDVELDRRKSGNIYSTTTRQLTGWSRNLFPLGNVHSGVMFGPLIFEIGVKDSKAGARVSCRRPPILGKSWSDSRVTSVLALDSNRILYKASGRFPDRPIQATVKQVIGGMFSGYHQHLQPLEDLVIKMLYSAAKNWTEKPLKSRQANYLTLRRQANAIITPLRFIMDGYLTPYLKAITTVLFNTDTDLRWGQYTNNCQNFCDAILQQPVFSTVFPTADHLYRLRKDRNTALLDYVVSFRTEPQLGNALKSTRLSPGPLTAFLKLFHRQTNVLEYQEEYGRKGNKNTPLCAETFAWRCHDEDCNLADHIWTNPAEFVSILQFHLMLDKNRYLQASENEWDAVPLSEKEWVKNRLAILQAIDSFATAAAAISRTFQNRLEGNKRPSWNPPRAPSIPQDTPFMMAGDILQYTQEDPGPGATSFFGKWFSRASSYQADVELPKAYGPNVTAAIVTPPDTNEG